MFDSKLTKKSGLAFVAAWLMTLSTPAFCDEGADVDHPPFPVAGKFSRTIQTVTGLNFLGGLIASIGAKKVLQHQLGKGNISVKVQPYSFTDLFSGKIKRINVTFQRCLLKTVPIGRVTVTSSNPLWYDPGFRGHKRGLMAPIQFNIAAHVDREMIKSALNSPKVTSAIRGLRLDLPGLGSQQIQIMHPEVDLSENAVKIHALLITQGAAEDTGVPITICGRPTIEGPRIFLRDLKVDSPDIPNPEEFARFTDQLFNPLIDMGRFDRKTHAFRLTDVRIKPNEIEGLGTVVLAPKEEMKVSSELQQKKPKPQ